MPQTSLDHLRGVAGEVPLEHLEDAARVLQRLVARGVPSARRRCRAERRALVAGRSRSAAASRWPVAGARVAGAAASSPSYCQLVGS